MAERLLTAHRAHFSQAVISMSSAGSLKSALVTIASWKSTTATKGLGWEGELVVKHSPGHHKFEAIPECYGIYSYNKHVVID